MKPEVDTGVVTTRRAIKVQRHSIFRHLENGRKRHVYVYCENSGDLSLNLIERLPSSRGFRLERSSINTVLLSRCKMSLWTSLY
jgi:hypothetical protein